MVRTIKSILIVIVMIAIAAVTHAAEVTLAWDAPTEGTPPTGYRIFQRTGSTYDYSKPVWDGEATTCTVSIPDHIEVAFVARAYVAGGVTGKPQESVDSNELIIKPAPPAAPTSLHEALEKIIGGLQDIQKIIK